MALPSSPSSSLSKSNMLVAILVSFCLVIPTAQAWQTPTSTRRSSSIRSRSASTRLYYGDGLAADHAVTTNTLTRSNTNDMPKAKPVVVTSWQLRWSFWARQPAVDEESQKVDEYLEFLDKRYHQLHDNKDNTSSKKRKPQPAFNALAWLTQQSSSHDDEDESNKNSALPASASQQQDNAFYALGVAGLASQRLLQKHRLHVPSQQKKTTTQTQKQQRRSESITVESSAVSIPDETTTSKTLSLAISAFLVRFSPLMVRWHQLRQALLPSLSKRQLLKSVPTMLRYPPLLAKRAFAWGGGSKNVALAASVLVAFMLFIVRPAAHAFWSAASTAAAAASQA